MGKVGMWRWNGSVGNVAGVAWGCKNTKLKNETTKRFKIQDAKIKEIQTFKNWHRICCQCGRCGLRLLTVTNPSAEDCSLPLWRSRLTFQFLNAEIARPRPISFHQANWKRPNMELELVIPYKGEEFNHFTLNATFDSKMEYLFKLCGRLLIFLKYLRQILSSPFKGVAK